MKEDLDLLYKLSCLKSKDILSPGKKLLGEYPWRMRQVLELLRGKRAQRKSLEALSNSDSQLEV